jgi:hypothetical protein
MTQLAHRHQPLQQSIEPQDGSVTTLDTSTEDQLLLDDLAEHFGEIPDEENDVEAMDLTQDISRDFLSVSYHIVFSPSYQVPVLYFNAYKPGMIVSSLSHLVCSSSFSNCSSRIHTSCYTRWPSDLSGGYIRVSCSRGVAELYQGRWAKRRHITARSPDSECAVLLHAPLRDRIADGNHSLQTDLG